MNWTYTNIQHGPRIELGISPNEYCVLDVYYQTQASPKYSVNGWSENSYQQISDFLGFSKGAVHKMVDRFVTAGLMEVNPANPKQKRTTEAWYATAYERVQKVNDSEMPVQKVNAAVQKVNASRSKSERHIEEREYKRELKEKGTALEISLPAQSKTESTKPVASVGILASLDEVYRGEENKAEAIYQRCIEQLTANSMIYPNIKKKARINITKNQFAEELKKWIEYRIHESQFFASAHKRMEYGKGAFVSWLNSDKTRDYYEKLNAPTVTTTVLIGESPFEKLRKLRQTQTV